MGRAPFVVDEAWVRWISAITGGKVRMRSFWGDVAVHGETHPSFCPVYEPLEWSIIRMLREEVDGVERSPPSGLLLGAADEVPSGTCSGVPSWRVQGSRERGIVAAYGPGKADPEPDVELAFEPLLQLFQDFPRLTVQLIGHCDISERPSERGRAALSLLRAKRVRTLLIERGVSPERISVKGVGAESLSDEGRSAEARARNRRIDLQLGPVAE